jgi:phospholipid-binding lipoprotein MlaA
MKKVCSIVSVCLALLLTGCVSVRHKTPKPFYGNPFDQTGKIFSKNVLASKQNRSGRFFLDKKIRPHRSGENNYDSEYPHSNPITLTVSKIRIWSALENSSFDQNGEHGYNRDYSLDGEFGPIRFIPRQQLKFDFDIPINAENERRSLKFSLEKSGQAEFSEFENEFRDTLVDTQGKGVYDPLMGFNRLMYRFNDKLYFWFLKPVSKGYGKILPEEIRIALNRFFKNLSFPVRFVNNALQGKFKQTGIETLRFVMNSTLGILGISDPAYSLLNLRAYEEDFGQTLGHYGVGDGFPLVLPFLGPSNLRDSIGIIPDLFFYPIAFLDPDNQSTINQVFLGVKIWEVVNRTSLRIGLYENLKKDALDPYTFMRDTYKQNRDANIKE